MTALPSSFTGDSGLLCLFLILLIPFAHMGLGLVSCGLGRSRSAAHVMLSTLCVTGVAVVVYVVIGASFAGGVGTASHSIVLNGKSWNWLAAGPIFLRGQKLDLSPSALAILLQVFGVALAAAIPISSGADRWKLGAACVSTILLAGWTYPVFSHWVWGGGWLAQLAQNGHLGQGFIDAGGAGTIQVVGGFTALSMAWILGPRHGKYSEDGIPAALPGHNMVFALLGCLLVWIGWIGLNSSGAILFAGVEPSIVVGIALNTTLSACSSVLSAAIVTRIRFGRPDVSFCVNGWIAGLVASSASAALLRPASAIFVGIVAGIIVPFAVELLEVRLAIDDPAGAISVHGIAGLWGVLAVALFWNPDSSSGLHGQFLAQLVGIATLLGFVLPMSYTLNWLLNHFYPQRVELEGELQGMDVHELGAGAYPEFVVHRDDFMFR